MLEGTRSFLKTPSQEKKSVQSLRNRSCVEVLLSRYQFLFHSINEPGLTALLPPVREGGGTDTRLTSPVFFIKVYFSKPQPLSSTTVWIADPDGDNIQPSANYPHGHCQATFLFFRDFGTWDPRKAKRARTILEQMILQNKSSRDAACPTAPGEGSSETEAENGRKRVPCSSRASYSNCVHWMQTPAERKLPGGCNFNGDKLCSGRMGTFPCCIHSGLVKSPLRTAGTAALHQQSSRGVSGTWEQDRVLWNQINT